MMEMPQAVRHLRRLVTGDIDGTGAWITSLRRAALDVCDLFEERLEEQLRAILPGHGMLPDGREAEELRRAVQRFADAFEAYRGDGASSDTLDDVEQLVQDLVRCVEDDIDARDSLVHYACTHVLVLDSERDARELRAYKTGSEPHDHDAILDAICRASLVPVPPPIRAPESPLPWKVRDAGEAEICGFVDDASGALVLHGPRDTSASGPSRRVDLDYAAAAASGYLQSLAALSAAHKRIEQLEKLVGMQHDARLEQEVKLSQVAPFVDACVRWLDAPGGSEEEDEAFQDMANARPDRI